MTLTDLPDGGLIELLARLTAWAGYAGAQLAAAEVDEEELQRAYELAEAESLVKTWGEGSTAPVGPNGGRGEQRVAVAKAVRLTDPTVQAAQQRELQAYASRKMLTALWASLDREAFIVSRELTRRVGGQAQVQRERVGRYRA